jgi:hypothetical protein
MAWSMNDGVGDTYNLVHSTGAQSVFALKQLLKSAGWTVLSSSDGTNYNAGGDEILVEGAGLTGMNNNYAWFRITDPGARREYLFQRYTNHYSWIVVYSALDKFTGGAPNATTRPTAADEKGVLRGVTAIASAASISPSAGTWNCHVAAQTAPDGNVYPFWMLLDVSAGTVAGYLTACDSLESGSYSSLDTDPCWNISANTVTATNLNGNSTGAGYVWMRMNMSGESWSISSVAAFYYGGGSMVIPGSISANPDDSKWLLVAPTCGVESSTDPNKGPKGILTNFRWTSNPTTTPYGNLFDTGALVYVCTPHLALPGWLNAAVNPTV